MTLGVGIVGCGLVGKKRASALASARLVACCDVVPDRARDLAGSTARVMKDWRELVESSDVQIVLVSTPNDSLVSVSLAALSAGKHVLVEKPAARKAEELEPLLDASKRAPGLVRVGFNHRYHPAMRKARELLDGDALGPLMFARARYGHGGRPGYDREWRARPEVSGGGELIDQGVHLIDLARWYLGEFPTVQGFVHTYFWDMQVEDNGFLLLRTAKDQAAFLHASCTEWKNLFSFEIYGKRGKIEITGLGGSYGTERIAYYRMTPEMGPPETTIWEYPQADTSWELEFREFLEDIQLRREPSPGLRDAQAALEIVGKIYRSRES